MFEPMRADAACDFCTGRRQPARLDIDAVYCISLVEQPHRTRYAAAHFHAIGLCRSVVFYRPQRLDTGNSLGVWVSHRAVARRALAEGQRRVLIMEDDVSFRRPIGALAPRINRALAKLPADWWGLFLGHIPIQAYFVRPGLLRARSAGLHAYIANVPLLQWYEATEERSPDVALWPPLHRSIDAATSCLPGMYAVFPMIALQKPFGDGRIDPRFDAQGQRRRWTDIDRWRYRLIFRGALALEALAVVASPFHRFTLDRFLRRLEDRAWATKTIRASGLFDAEFYLKTYADIAAAKVDPLNHYLDYGGRERRQPSAAFDPHVYAGRAVDLSPDDNPLLHYMTVGRARGYPIAQ